MNILLTGASGFTGKHFAALAHARGHMITALQANLTEEHAVRHELETTGVDAVVHLAGLAFVGHGTAIDFYQVNVLGAENLLKSLRACRVNPSAVLVASSANVYGNARQSPVSEAQQPAPVNHYACSKLAMEHMARTHADDLPLVVARPFNYTGVGQSPDFVVPKVVQHFKERRTALRLGNLTVRREFNDVRWLCEAYLALLDPKNAGLTVNVCTGRSYCLQDLLDLASGLSGHRLRVEQDPALMRANEIADLRGDGELLDRLCPSLEDRDLEATVRWMLRDG